MCHFRSENKSLNKCIPKKEGEPIGGGIHLLMWVKKELPESQSKQLPKNFDGIPIDINKRHFILMMTEYGDVS
jgi:hypothetical protein